LGRDLPPPAEPHLGSAGYSLAAAVAEVAFIIEQDLVPAVDRMFQRQLPLREEIRALVEDEVMPLIEPTIAVMQQGPLPFTTEQEFEEPAPYRVPGQPLPLSWMLADREAEDAEYATCEGMEPVGITFSGPEGVVDEGWGPDVDSDEEELEREREEKRLLRLAAQKRVERIDAGAARGGAVSAAGGFSAQLRKGKMGAGAAVPGGSGLAGATGGGGGALGGGAAKLASLFGGGGKAGAAGAVGATSGGGGGLGMMAALKAATWVAKVRTRARAKRGTKVEASLLKAKEEGRLMEHIKELMVKAKNAPTEAMRKKLRNYIADVVHTAVEDGVLKREEAKSMTAGRAPAPRQDAFGGASGSGGGGAGGGGQEQQQGWAGDDDGYQETEYSEGDDAYLYDNYGSEYAYSDYGDEEGGGDGGWAGDDPSWQASQRAGPAGN
jgi:hypothetical protein